MEKNGNTKWMGKNRQIINTKHANVYVSEQHKLEQTHGIYLNKLMQLLFGFIVQWFPFEIFLLI